MAIAPKSVDVSLTQGVTIEWADGHVSRYGIKYLRDACPCATCTNAHGDAPTSNTPGALPIFKPAGATLRSVQPVGRYALQFFFSDDHNTGIYSWEYLRSLCACEDCKRLQKTATK
jgi:DUF971 family protein